MQAYKNNPFYSLLRHLFFLYSGHKTFTNEKRTHFYVASISLAASRVFQLIFLFIPIKLIILMSKHNLPSYMKAMLKHYSLHATTWILIIFIPFSFLGYILCGTLFRYCLDKDSKRLDAYKFYIKDVQLNKSQLMKLHEYIIKSQSECIVLVLGIIVISLITWFYSLLFIIVLAAFGIIIEITVFHHTDKTRVTPLKLTQTQFIEYISSVSYILLTALLCMEVGIFHTNLYLAILCLLASRMILQAAKRFFTQKLNKPKYGKLFSVPHQ